MPIVALLEQAKRLHVLPQEVPKLPQQWLVQRIFLDLLQVDEEQFAVSSDHIGFLRVACRIHSFAERLACRLAWKAQNLVYIYILRHIARFLELRALCVQSHNVGLPLCIHRVLPSPPRRA